MRGRDVLDLERRIPERQRREVLLDACAQVIRRLFAGALPLRRESEALMGERAEPTLRDRSAGEADA